MSTTAPAVTGSPAPPSSPPPVSAPPRAGRAWHARRAAGLLACAGLVLVLAVLGIGIGAKSIAPGDVVHALLTRDPQSDDWIVVRTSRLPRSLFGIVIGASLGLAGALMQALTRNPLADPGLLGVNAGAAAAVAGSTALLDLGSFSAYVWAALLGAAVAAAVVYLLGTRGRSRATPVRLALAGTAVSAVLTAFVNGLVLLDPLSLNKFRFWQIGTLAGQSGSVLVQVLPFLGAGAVLAALLARPLNAIALGEDTARSLGAHPGRTQFATMAAVTLLCGAATAAVGPIAFVGLAVPHLARLITGPDQRWLLPYSAVLAAALLLAADIVGRVVLANEELEAGVVTAFLGAPLFIALVRRKRIAQL
ncbi:FecCD family ABC transporter permease [Streptomyces huiliensis]|uniref:FecCD family ABC transporter permease n=1 Tax=Streptomyces huiliensis TaxID=2876027 RepID=UPI001CBFC575|nr:iron chelate uptake ABC transporter family permease subunit [Streptomyces huiliensis]MBZ4322427.1 iron chelate uptake ABC transporter family permease subunit [Streptomyces huiliensis]